MNRFERSDRAQTESLATILMVAIVVTTVGVASVAVLERQQPESATTADLSAEITDTDLTVLHRGGDALALDSLLVVVENETESWRYRPATAGVVAGDADDSFEPGERWELSSVPYQSGDVVSVAIYDTAGSSQLTADSRVVRTPSGGGSLATTTTPTTTTSTTTTTTSTTTTTTAPPEDTEKPTVGSFTVQSRDDRVKGKNTKAKLTVSWNVSDNRVVSNVTVTLTQDGATLDRHSTEPGTADTSGSALLEQEQKSKNNSYTIVLTATDAAGNSRTKTLNYSVSDQTGA